MPPCIIRNLEIIIAVAAYMQLNLFFNRNHNQSCENVDIRHQLYYRDGLGILYMMLEYIIMHI